ncbi:MAG: nucleotidyltransferase family protein [Ginsengibacter sp.]
MIKQAVILAGGLGTRLRPLISEVPKCLAPVNGNPFLHYLISYLQKNGIERFIFSVGYLHEKVEAFLKSDYPGLNYQLALEEEPLGTGGAIKLAIQQATDKNVIVCNGDTMFKVDIQALAAFHFQTNADCSLSLKPMVNFDRYGVVSIDGKGAVQSFKEKQFYQSGLINGGVYALNTNSFNAENLPEKFSFEKDYLEKKVNEGSNYESEIFGFIQDQYFIDIGIPEDYERAKLEF